MPKPNFYRFKKLANARRRGRQSTVIPTYREQPTAAPATGQFASGSARIQEYTVDLGQYTPNPIQTKEMLYEKKIRHVVKLYYAGLDKKGLLKKSANFLEMVEKEKRKLPKVK